MLVGLAKQPTPPETASHRSSWSLAALKWAFDCVGRPARPGPCHREERAGQPIGRRGSVEFNGAPAMQRLQNCLEEAEIRCVQTPDVIDAVAGPCKKRSTPRPAAKPLQRSGPSPSFRSTAGSDPSANPSLRSQRRAHCTSLTDGSVKGEVAGPESAPADPRRLLQKRVVPVPRRWLKSRLSSIANTPTW